MNRNSAYFSRRAQEERLAAGKAGSHAVRDVHLEMARRYDELAMAPAAATQPAASL